MNKNHPKIVNGGPKCHNLYFLRFYNHFDNNIAWNEWKYEKNIFWGVKFPNLRNFLKKILKWLLCHNKYTYKVDKGLKMSVLISSIRIDNNMLTILQIWGWKLSKTTKKCHFLYFLQYWGPDCVKKRQKCIKKDYWT